MEYSILASGVLLSLGLQAFKFALRWFKDKELGKFTLQAITLVLALLIAFLMTLDGVKALFPQFMAILATAVTFYEFVLKNIINKLK